MADVGLVDGPEFHAGETDTDRDYRIRQDGAVVDLTNYTAVKLYARDLNTGEDLAAIAGSFVSPRSGGVVRFSHDNLTARAASVYRADVELTSASGTRRVRRSIRIPVSESVGS